jgi:hypothetical protein
MSKTFLKVADDFDGIINAIQGSAAGSYGAGDLIVIDDTSPEGRAISDLGTHALSNAVKGGTAIGALITSGTLALAGNLSEDPGGQFATASRFLDLVALEDDLEVLRVKPGFAGRVSGISFQASADATTSGKAASIGLSIEGSDLSDEINTVTVSSLTTPFVLTVSAGEDVFTTADIAYNAATSAVKSALVAAGIDTADVAVTGSPGAYVITWGGALLNTNISITATRHEIVTVVQNATGGTHTLVYDGGDPETVAANATEAAFQTAVDAVLADSGLEATVVRTGSANGYTYTITSDAAVNLAAFTTVTTNLTGGTQAAAVTVVQQGGATGVAAATTVGGGSGRIVGASGNPATLDLTSANVTNGGIVAGETIATGTNANHGNFGVDDVIVATVSGVTAFVEGGGVLTVYLTVD